MQITIAENVHSISKQLVFSNKADFLGKELIRYGIGPCNLRPVWIAYENNNNLTRWFTSTKFDILFAFDIKIIIILYQNPISIFFYKKSLFPCSLLPGLVKDKSVFPLIIIFTHSFILYWTKWSKKAKITRRERCEHYGVQSL